MNRSSTANSTLEAIEIRRWSARQVIAAGGADVVVKLEYYNPTGSYKDRMALAMIEGAERRGALKPGMRVTEYTGGSTGSSLAMICAVKGYPLTPFVGRIRGGEVADHERVRRRPADHSQRRAANLPRNCFARCGIGRSGKQKSLGCITPINLTMATPLKDTRPWGVNCWNSLAEMFRLFVGRSGPPGCWSAFRAH